MADPGDELTVTDAIASLRARGFVVDFGVAPPGLVRCGACEHLHVPDDLVVEVTLRIEGVSDPDDQAAVFGLICERCQIRGVLVVAYGPSASAEEAAVLTSLRDVGDPAADRAATHGQTCPRCGEEFSGTTDVVVEAVVAHARDAHDHRLDPDVVRAHLESRHPFDDR
jgi:hypothetical protein